MELDSYRLLDDDVEKLIGVKPKRNSQRLPKPKSGEWYLFGGIPGNWLALAASLGGKSLNVALAIWHVVKLAKGKPARLTTAELAKFATSRQAARRSLCKLEAAGLITVDRQQGRAPRVAILDLNPEVSK
jgi:hypothetical protein